MENDPKYEYRHLRSFEAEVFAHWEKEKKKITKDLDWIERFIASHRLEARMKLENSLKDIKVINR